MDAEPADQTDRHRSPDGFDPDSAVARLVCMYLERVPAASSEEIARDLQLSEQVITAALGVLAERGTVQEQAGIFVLPSEEIN